MSAPLHSHIAIFTRTDEHRPRISQAFTHTSYSVVHLFFPVWSWLWGTPQGLFFSFVWGSCCPMCRRPLCHTGIWGIVSFLRCPEMSGKGHRNRSLCDIIGNFDSFHLAGRPLFGQCTATLVRQLVNQAGEIPEGLLGSDSDYEKETEKLKEWSLPSKSWRNNRDFIWTKTMVLFFITPIALSLCCGELLAGIFTVHRISKSKCLLTLKSHTKHQEKKII